MGEMTILGYVISNVFIWGIDIILLIAGIALIIKNSMDDQGFVKLGGVMLLIGSMIFIILIIKSVQTKEVEINKAAVQTKSLSIVLETKGNQ